MLRHPVVSVLRSILADLCFQIFSLLHRYGLEGKKLTNEDLWLAFNCSKFDTVTIAHPGIQANDRLFPVFRGCIALAYPKRWRNGLDPDKEDVPLFPEQIPASGTMENPRMKSTRKGLVHFDLDVMNTMLGDFDWNHPLAPVVKVGQLCADIHVIGRPSHIATDRGFGHGHKIH